MVYNTRKRARKVVDPEPANPDNAPTPVKRAKKVKSAEKTKLPSAPRVRRKGALQELPKMPLDIIDEVYF